jgi:hypothetical protein
MPLSTTDHLDDLYAKQRVLMEEAARLEIERGALDVSGEDTIRQYILELEITALREEATRIAARISAVLDRDLQR